MTEPLDRLQAALADRYRLDREIGAGGMATVYLAEDLKHRRHVALKVLRPELSAVLGAERFLKEIELTAKLQHPHLLPLFDSGEAVGLLYYVMPYVEGESFVMPPSGPTVVRCPRSSFSARPHRRGAEPAAAGITGRVTDDG
jgi:eukaryotic-like serine/threonine-protein kinase